MKVALIVQARMGSKRLPGKVMMAAHGQPLLGHQIDRLRQVKLAQQIVIATTLNPFDDAIADFCAARHTAVFRGSEEDVLARFAEAAQANGVDVIVRLTADCPLIDPAVTNRSLPGFLPSR